MRQLPCPGTCRLAEGPLFSGWWLCMKATPYRGLRCTPGAVRKACSGTS